MFKNVKWGALLKNIALLIIAALTGAAGNEIKNLVSGEPSTYAASAPDYSKLNFISDGGSDATAPFSAIYRVQVYSIVDRIGGGPGLPATTTPVPVWSQHTIKIHGTVNADKIRNALEQNQALPYGGVLDKVWNTELVMWVKRPSSSGEVPTPQDPVTE